jgi:hypothetical protein
MKELLEDKNVDKNLVLKMISKMRVWTEFM